jgi:hypothetical protein
VRTDSEPGASRCLTGLRRVYWVRIGPEGCEVSGTAGRIPVRQRIPLRMALALVRDGAPLVTSVPERRAS